VVAQSSDTLISTSADANERRPAVWPWLVMPLVVLLVYLTLHSVHQMPEKARAGAESHAPASDAGDTSEQ
jgi:hypothetical protein